MKRSKSKSEKIIEINEGEPVADKIDDHIATEETSQATADDQTSADEATETEERPEPTPEERIEQLEDSRLRAVADLENFKKRMSRQFGDIITTANDRLLVSLLEIVDNFERALSSSHESPEAKAFHDGSKLIYNQMLDLLGKFDVKPIESLGKDFDPKYHEAMMQIESEDYSDGVVAIEINKGYMIGDRVLRHSKVGVSRGKTQAEKEKK